MPLQPVRLPAKNADGSYASGLSFDELARCHTASKSALFKGRDGCPPWASNLRSLGLLLARYFEKRAGFKHPRIDSPERRVVHAVSKILADVPANVALLDRLTAEYITTKDVDAARARVLERQIRSLDGRLVIDKGGPSLIVGIIYWWGRMGYDSSETSVALHHQVSPVAVRQIASRLTHLWEKMQNGTDQKPNADDLRKAKRRAWWNLTYRPVQCAKEKAARAAETPEQRAARLQYHRDYYHAHHDRILAQGRASWKKRDRALLAYRAMTPEQIAERQRKARVYAEKKRDKLNADARRRYAVRVAKMSEAERAIRNAQARAYFVVHHEQITANHRRHRARKRAFRADTMIRFS